MPLKDMTGLRFGRLVVLYRDNSQKDKCTEAKWICQCDCGNVVSVRGSCLRNGCTQSCGCLCIERTIESHTTHGKRNTKLYYVWDSMKQRCLNESHHAYDLYGGRGIAIYDMWLNSFTEFEKWALENGYRDGLSLDRINTDLGYFPENCRWVNMKVQQNNRRNNVRLEFNGESRTMSEWASITGIRVDTIWRRLHKGWDVGAALTTPVDSKKSHSVPHHKQGMEV